MRLIKYVILSIALSFVIFGCKKTKPNKDCISKPCKLSKDKYGIDGNGNRFIKGQIVFSTKKTEEGMDPVNPKTIAEDLRYIIKKVLSKDPGTIEYQVCPCGDNIILLDYGNTIGGETTVVTAGNQEEKEENPGREGEYSLNYLVNNVDGVDSEGIPDYFPITGVSFKDTMTELNNKKVIAILDSGIDLGRFVGQEKGFLFKDINGCSGVSDQHGYNTIDHNGDVEDDNGHGTMVALTYKHGLDRLDVNYWLNNQSVLNVKVLNECGYGNSYSISCGLKYAESRNVDVINLSLGMYFYDKQIGRTIRELNRDILIVCSGGNKSKLLINAVGENHYPSGISNNYTYTNGITLVPMLPLKNVFEIFSLERSVMDGCVNGSLSFGKAGFSCYRSDGFAEPGIGVQNLLPDINNCPIQGTSFSAPLFSASTMRYLIQGTNLQLIKNRTIYNTNPLVPITGTYFFNADWMEKCNSSPGSIVPDSN